MSKDKIQSDFNLLTISTKEYEKIAKSAIDQGTNCFVVGPRGIGKTAIAEKAIKESGLRRFFWNISTLERVDMAGFPDIASPARKEEYIKYILPDTFKPLLEGNTKVV